MALRPKILPLFIFTLLFVAVFLLLHPSSSAPLNTSSVLGDSETTLYIPNNYKNYGQPSGITLMPDGSIWYIDALNTRLVHVSSSGTILRTIGRQGNDQGEFHNIITDITHDTDGNIYVLGETGAYKFDSNGGYVTYWSETDDETSFQLATGIDFDTSSNTILISERLTGMVLRFSTSGTFIAKYGSFGSGDGQTDNPRGLATDSDGNIYIADMGNQRVMVLNSDGTYKMKFGSYGGGDGEFNNPTDVAVASNGNVFVVAQDIPKIQIFSSSGAWVSSWGEAGTSAWQLQSPYSIDIDGSGNVWLSNWGSKAMQRFSPSGVFISSIRNSGNVGGRLSAPMDVKYDSIGNLYVLDNNAGGGRVQKFTNAGTYLQTIVNTFVLDPVANFMFIDSDNKIYITSSHKVMVFDTSGNILLQFGIEGTGDGQFRTASGLAVDSAKNIYVADKLNSRVQKFDSNGTYITQWGTHGSGHGEFCFSEMAPIVIDSSDMLYIADNCAYNPTPIDGINFNTRIEVYNTSGVYQHTIGSYERGVDGKFFIIEGMAFDSLGRLQVSDFDCKIQIFDPDGTYISIYGAKTVGSTCGSDVGELQEPHGLALNHITDRVTIADMGNDRVQLIPSGTRIYNLISSADVISNDGTTSLVSSYFDPTAPGVNHLTSSMFFGGYIVSDFSVNLTADRDWQQVNVITLPDSSVSLVVNLNPTTAPGVSSSHTLYVPKKTGQTSVHVCPEAANVEEVTIDCTNGYTLVPGAILSTVNINGLDYWKVTGLTGTGILGIDAPTPSPTATASPTATSSVTATATATPTITQTTTPTATPTVTTTLPPVTTTSIPTTVIPTPSVVVKGAVPVCPTFTSFSANPTVLKTGESTTFSWATKNTEVVKTAASAKDLDPVGTFTFAPTQTTTVSFTADNGDCIAKKTITIYVVASLPWTNTITVGTGVLLVEAAIAVQQPALFGNLWLGFASLINRRKRRSWGYVYDSTTKKPLSRAVIRLLKKEDSTVIDTVVSEANGVFRLTPRAGSYLISVSHPHYSFPSKAITGTSDAGYIHIYLGEVIEVNDPSKDMLLSIPLDPVTLDETELRKIRFGKFFDSTLSIGSTLIMIGGFVYSVYTAVAFPHLYNYIILAAYFALISGKLYLNVQLPKTQGSVQTIDGVLLSGIELGIFDIQFNNLLYRTFTTSEGKYSFVVPNTDYSLKVMDQRYALQNSSTGSETVRITQKGKEHIRVIAEDLLLQKK